jgi:ABC-type proline/glycine betaine transport system ATPase subunit
MNVADNVEFALRVRRVPARKRRERREELLQIVGLSGMADRYPRQLSGGQQQRVGVARALAADAPIILMDEPFGAVDPITRKQLQRWLRQVQAEVHKTIVFVTHDINEAFLLGDRIVLMNNGAIEQNGTPAELLREPAGDFVREFIGDEFALQALEYTRIEELAKPVGRMGVPEDGLVLSGELSVPEASRELTQSDNANGEGFWIADDSGEPSGFVSYQDLATALGEGIASDPELVDNGEVAAGAREDDREEVADAIPS